MRFILMFTISFGLLACSGAPPPEQKGPGSILTGRSEQGLTFQDLGRLSGKNNGVGLPINALLWRASLDILATIPLDDVDTFGGTIVTEWYQLNETSDGIRVIVYLQKRAGNKWQDSGTDSEMGKKIEELILSRAREIRASSVVGSKI